MAALPGKPTGNNSDAGTDDPKLSLLTDLPGVIGAVGGVIDYLTELFGSDGTKATARATLGLTDLASDTGQGILGQKYKFFTAVEATQENFTVATNLASVADIAGQSMEVLMPATHASLAPTLTRDGKGTWPLTGIAGAQLAPGSFAAGQLLAVTLLDAGGGNFRWEITSQLATVASEIGKAYWWQNETTQWTVPNGVTKALVAVIAGAGGGKFVAAQQNGGDGGAAWDTIDVSSGDIYDIVAGAGGASGSSAGLAGSASSFSPDGGGSLLSATGGAGASSGASGANGGGTGGVVVGAHARMVAPAWTSVGLSINTSPITAGQFADVLHPGIGGQGDSVQETRGAHGIVFIKVLG